MGLRIVIDGVVTVYYLVRVNDLKLGHLVSSELFQHVRVQFNAVRKIDCDCGCIGN